jgi:hypothetical protein
LLSLKRSVDEADLLSGTTPRVAATMGGLGGLPEAGAFEAVAVPPGPILTDVGGLAYSDLLS